MFVAVDLETTGLDPRVDVPLELGIAIYTDDFELIDQYQSIIKPAGGIVNMSDLVRKMPPVVREMHVKSGLFDDLDNNFTTLKTLSIVETEAILFLEEYDAKNLPMTGSTISFDRAFLKAYMPNLEATFHYRNIDISTLKILSGMYANLEFPETAKLHRTLSDVQDSMNDLQFFIENFMNVPGEIDG